MPFHPRADLPQWRFTPRMVHLVDCFTPRMFHPMMINPSDVSPPWWYTPSEWFTPQTLYLVSYLSIQLRLSKFALCFKLWASIKGLEPYQLELHDQSIYLQIFTFLIWHFIMLTAIKMMYCVVELKCINDTIIYYCKYYSSTEFFCSHDTVQVRNKIHSVLNQFRY